MQKDIILQGGLQKRGYTHVNMSLSTTNKPLKGQCLKTKLHEYQIHISTPLNFFIVARF